MDRELQPPVSGLALEHREKAMTRLLLSGLVTALLFLIAGSAQAAPTAYTDEASYLSALAATPYQTFQEGFENDAAWGVARSPNAADSVSSQGIVWTSNHPDAVTVPSRITTGSGPALSGSWGAYSSPHGDPDRELSATACDVTPSPDPCLQHDGLLGTSTGGTLYGVGGWVSGTFGGQVVFVLGGNPVPLDFGDAGVISGGGHQFLGVIEPAGFTSFEVREIEGKTGDEKLIFADDFTMAGVFTPQPNLTVSSTSLAFGSVTVDTSADQTLTLTNAGDADLSLFDLAFVDPLAAPFELVAGQDGCSNQTLTPATSCTVVVRYAPTSTRIHSETFDIPSDDPDTPTVTVGVSGTGAPLPTPNLGVSATSMAFSSVTVGAAADQTLTLTNIGNANLSVFDLGFVDPLTAPFELLAGQDGCSNQTLIPATSCTVTVRYTPTEEAMHSDTFDIPSDDPDTSTVTVGVSGTGTPVPTPNLAVSTTSMAFGSVTIGSTADQTLTLSNTGDADLAVFQLASANPLAAPFSLVAGQDGCSNQTLGPAMGCTVVVRYAPTEEAMHNDGFDIPSDDPDAPTATVSVSGSGLPSAGNNPPTAPILWAPADGQVDAETRVTLRWYLSSDPDGDSVGYDIQICEDASFQGCPPVVAVAAVFGENTPYRYAGLGGIGLLALLLGFGARRRRTRALLLAVLVSSSLILMSCHPVNRKPSAAFQVDGLSANTTHYWKVIARDGIDSTESVVRSFTTK